jgi:tRNA pseudouridine38-40 synthase
MARYQIILTYDGTQFLGSQRQASSRTVQGELEKALRNIGWDGKTVYLAGRTDTGTHATGQVAAFDHDWSHGLKALHSALNTNLPRDLAVREVNEVPNAFHPRFDATSRCYRYRIYCAEVREPLRERFAWRVWPPVSDLTPLASIWFGKHDFGAFGTPPKAEGSTIRTVFSAKWTKLDDEWIFDIQADAFLYRMVRKLVYVQVIAGQGRLPLEILVSALKHVPGKAKPLRETIQSRIPANLAPACGLTLVEVRYDNQV